ncbi:MAG: hypothetical protein ACTSQB_05820, partial [Candidatus Heimdallarchaeota archaeon]
NKTNFSYTFANETTFRLSTNSTFSFDWRFENKEGYYIGIIIATTGPNLYLISHFSGNFGNNSGYLVLEYENEQVNTWYHHTLNLSRLYLDSYGEIPENITHVSIINRGYGSIDDGVATNQISYFDSLYLSSTGEIIDTPTPSNTSSISIPGFKIITGVLGMCIVSAVYISLAKRKK